MIVVGVVLLLIGFVAHIPVLWSVGVVLLLLGTVLWALGAAGHEIGGRRRYY